MDVQETMRRYRSRSRYVGYRDADLSWQQRVRDIRNPRDFVSGTDMRRSRMSFGVPLPEIGPDMQPIYGGSLRRTTRMDALAAQRRAREERYVPLADRSGLRGTVAAAALLTLAAVLLIIIFSNHARLRREQQRVADINARITAIEAQCESLEAQYEERLSEVDVIYAAVGRGMIAASGTQAIGIEVPTNVVVRPAEMLGK